MGASGGMPAAGEMPAAPVGKLVGTAGIKGVAMGMPEVKEPTLTLASPGLTMNQLEYRGRGNPATAIQFLRSNVVR
jgi:hypothetical protein